MALFKKRTVGKPGEWYYCLEHGTVEEGPECPAKDRFGPYASPRFRLGSTVVDVDRDDVIVCGLSDTRIPWPLGRR